MQKVIVTAAVHMSWTEFRIDDTKIASIDDDIRHKNRHVSRVFGFSGNDGCCDNQSYVDALDFVTDVIERRFARLGLSVEFK